MDSKSILQNVSAHREENEKKEIDTNLKVNKEDQRPKLDEIDSGNEILNKSATLVIDDIGSRTVNLINKILKNPKAVVMPPTDLRSMNQELDPLYVQGLDDEQRINLINHVINSHDMEGVAEIKQLLKYFVSAWSQNTETSNNDANYLKKYLVGTYIEDVKVRLNLNEAQRNIADNLKLIIERFYQNVPSVQAAARREERGTQSDWNEMNEERDAFFQKIDENPMLDQEEKLIRKIEYDRTFEATRMELADKFSTEKGEIEKIGYRYEINKMEQELKDYQAGRELINNDIERLKNELTNPTLSGPEREQKELHKNELEAIFKNHFTSHFKTNLFAMDNKQETTKNRAADETLHPEQIKRVRELDRWLFKEATNDYKDKSFMVQMMGCTIRERLAMYLYVEMNMDKLDNAMLSFSQANYLPNMNTIKRKLHGWSFLRRIGAKRIHWSKMRRAFEFATSKGATIEAMANVAKDVEVDIQDRNVGVQLQHNGMDVNDRTTKKLKGKVKDQDLKDTVAAMREDLLHAEVCTVSAALITTIQKLRENDGNQENLRNALAEHVKKLRIMADREEELAKDQGAKKHWSRFGTFVTYFGKINKYYGTGSSIAGEVKRDGLFDNENFEFAKTWLDYGNYGAQWAGLANNLFKMIKSTGDLIKNATTSSSSANVKATVGLLQSLVGTGSSVNTAWSMVSEYGWGIDAFRKSKQKLAEKMQERLGQGLSSYEFDTSKLATKLQIGGSMLTVASSYIDYRNIHKSRKAANTLKEQVQNRQKQNEMVDAEYREKNYKRSLANLTKRLNVRKGITATVNIVSNGAGYLKYILSTPAIGIISEGVSVGISYISDKVDKLLKRRSDYKTVDDFLDMDQMLQEYHTRNPQVDVTKTAFRDQFRKNAMLQLGFANTKTFFSHVAKKLGEMVRNVLEGASTGAIDADQANPIKTIVKAMGLRVNYAKNIIPTAQQIANKLSA